MTLVYGLLTILTFVSVVVYFHLFVGPYEDILELRYISLVPYQRLRLRDLTAPLPDGFPPTIVICSFIISLTYLYHLDPFWISTRAITFTLGLIYMTVMMIAPLYIIVWQIWIWTHRRRDDRIRSYAQQILEMINHRRQQKHYQLLTLDDLFID